MCLLFNLKLLTYVCYVAHSVRKQQLMTNNNHKISKMAVTGSGSAVGNIRRVVVGLKSGDTSSVILANFVDCIVNYFNPNGLSVQLCCTLENNVLVLSPPPPDCDKHFQQQTNSLDNINTSPTHVTASMSVVLEHSPGCPLWRLKKGGGTPPPDRLDQGVQVGVATILESSDGRLLVTQRAQHMRTFPRAWVPPGGHVEPGESLAEGAQRELSEETGLDLAMLPHRTRTLCMWESVYPPYLGMGSPRNHHVVVYVHTRVDATWSELHARLKLDADEVQGCVWLSQRDIEIVCSASEEPFVVEKYVLEPDDRLVSEPLDLTGLFPIRLADRNYSGLQMAFNKWLESKTGSKQCPCKI